MLPVVRLVQPCVNGQCQKAAAATTTSFAAQMQARCLMVDGNAKTNESTGAINLTASLDAFDGVNIPRSQCVFSSFGCHRADFDCGPGACCDEAKPCSRAPDVDEL